MLGVLEINDDVGLLVKTKEEAALLENTGDDEKTGVCDVKTEDDCRDVAIGGRLGITLEVCSENELLVDVDTGGKTLDVVSTELDKVSWVETELDSGAGGVEDGKRVVV